MPFRKLSDERGLSLSQTFKLTEKEMNALPDNNWLTFKYCNRFSGLLVIDGKYVKVKGFKQKIPFIYGIDYLTHDIPVGILAPSESHEAFLKFFRILKTCSYPLKAVICDDVIPSLKRPLERYYPKALIQLCHTHYLENFRQLLQIRTKRDHQHFFQFLEQRIFKNYKNEKDLNNKLYYLFKTRAKRNALRQQIIIDIYRRRQELFQFVQTPHCPNNTNLLELFNSHLNPRLEAIKGFKSFHSAERWLNAWMLRRRTKPFTDCQGRFKHLNSKCSLEITIKKQTRLSEILSKYKLKMHPK